MPHRPPSILLGSTNPAKMQRLRACLDGWPFDTVSIDELPPHEPPSEMGGTHNAIAQDKALAWARISGGLAIASDGGIDIPALGRHWDSTRTRRAAGEDATDEGRIRHLLALMESLKSDAERTATWTEALAIATPSGIVQTREAAGAAGVIQREPSAVRIEGFWLAPILRIPRFGKVYGELTVAELQNIADPWATLRTQIQEWLTEGGHRTLQEA